MSTIKSIIEEFHLEQIPETDIWYLATVVVMSSVNRPEDVKHVYNAISSRIDSFASLSKLEKNKLLASIVLRLREAILKSYIIIGFPKTINTLQELSDVTPDYIKALLPTKPLRKEESWADVQNERERGKTLFSTIYNKHADKVIKNMYNYHPDLAQTALYQLYGPILAETSILSARETSLITVSALMIQNVPLQLKGHSHGALNNGATKQDIELIQYIVSTLAEYYKYPIAKL